MENKKIIEGYVASLTMATMPLFKEATKKIQNGEIKEQRLLKNQKEFMKNHFDLDTALNEYVEMIKTL